MGWGNKTTSTNTQQQTQQSSNTTTPNLNPMASGLYGNLTGQVSDLLAQAKQPVYGQAQTADVLNNLNGAANAATANLKSTLAGNGQLDSGAFAAGAGNIQQQRYGQLSNFYTNLPAMEQAAQTQRMSQAIGLGDQVAASMPVGNTSTGSGSSNGSSDSTQVQSQGLGSLVGSLLGSVGGAALGGFGSMMNGGSFTSGFGNSLQGGGGGGYNPYMPSINAAGGLGYQPLPMPPTQSSVYGGYSQ